MLRRSDIDELHCIGWLVVGGLHNGWVAFGAYSCAAVSLVLAISAGRR